MKVTVKQARILAGLTQQEVADALGIAKSTYFNKENGAFEFTLREAQQFAELVGRTVEEIIFLQPERSENRTEGGETND